MARWTTRRMDIVGWTSDGWAGAGMKMDMGMDGFVAGSTNGHTGEGKKAMIGYMEGICINRWVCIIHVLIEEHGIMCA